MDRKFICDECPNIYSSRQGRWRHKKNEHAKSVPCHSYTSQCKNQVKGGDLETNDTLREIMKMLKTSKDEPVENNEKTEMEQPWSKKKSVPEKDEEPMKFDNRPRDTAMFEDVTSGDKEKFVLLLNKLKKHLKGEDFVKIDKLLPQYFKNESEFNHYGWGRTGEAVTDEIGQELRNFQRQAMPLISLELQILLDFMDKKRQALNDLLAIIKNGDEDKSLERVSLHGVITEDEKRQLMKELSRDTIARVLSNRKFTPMNSEI